MTTQRRNANMFPNKNASMYPRKSVERTVAIFTVAKCALLRNMDILVIVIIMAMAISLIIVIRATMDIMDNETNFGNVKMCNKK